MTWLASIKFNMNINTTKLLAIFVSFIGAVLAFVFKKPDIFIDAALIGAALAGVRDFVTKSRWTQGEK
jgi:hypothetical protein